MKIWAHDVEAFIAALDIKTANVDTMVLGLCGIVIPPHVSVTESSNLWAGTYMVEGDGGAMSVGEYEAGALERAGFKHPMEDA